MLTLHNTMSRKKEKFTPRDPKNVKMFTCGPSIYRRPHLGNYRSFVWEDLLQRYLEYSGYKVSRVINFTDVEDKAIAEAEEAGLSLDQLTDQNAQIFFNEADLLKIKLPNRIPRSSTSVDQAVGLIRILLEKGYAYWDKGDVFFDPLKFEGFGKLFRLDMKQWPKKRRLFRKDTYPGRRWNLGDFILWHGFKEGDKVYWDTEIGRGRPSWNIQDPAMITPELGFEIDISCGGVDNLYRHHDYNIAVIESISGREFAPYWIHGEHLLSNGKKMSKSIGNIVYPEDLIREDSQPRHIRFYLLYGHHRKKMNLTREDLRKKQLILDGFSNTVEGLIGAESAGSSPGTNGPAEAESLLHQIVNGFEAEMNDDLNVKGAFDRVSEAVSKLERVHRDVGLSNSQLRRLEESLRRIDSVLQVIFVE